MASRCDPIGLNYSHLRKPDPRIAALIEAALGGARTILNVGAGAGESSRFSQLLQSLQLLYAALIHNRRPVSIGSPHLAKKSAVRMAGSLVESLFGDLAASFPDAPQPATLTSATAPVPST